MPKRPGGLRMAPPTGPREVMRARPERLWLGEPVWRLGALANAQVRTDGAGRGWWP